MVLFREPITKEILISWDREVGVPSCLLSTLNVYMDFLSAFDQFLASSAGWDCRMNLLLETMEERGFRFSLEYEALPSPQLYLGEGSVSGDVLEWLNRLHGETLECLASLTSPEDLEALLNRARLLAEEYRLDRELIFSLTPSPRDTVHLERRFHNLLTIQRELYGGINLKILKK